VSYGLHQRVTCGRGNASARPKQDWINAAGEMRFARAERAGPIKQHRPACQHAPLASRQAAGLVCVLQRKIKCVVMPCAKVTWLGGCPQAKSGIQASCGRRFTASEFSISAVFFPLVETGISCGLPVKDRGDSAGQLRPTTTIHAHASKSGDPPPVFPQSPVSCSTQFGRRPPVSRPE